MTTPSHQPDGISEEAIDSHTVLSFTEYGSNPAHKETSVELENRKTIERIQRDITENLETGSASSFLAYQ